MYRTPPLTLVYAVGGGDGATDGSGAHHHGAKGTGGGHNVINHNWTGIELN